MPRDYYEVLGVGRDADRAEVKTAFRRLARELHPDVNDHDPEAEEKFKEAAEAYEVLSDPERRRAYDAYGHEGLRGRRLPAGRRLRLDRGHLPGLLRRPGHPLRGRRGPMRGQDLVHPVEITAIDAMLGATIKVPSHEGEREIELPSGTQHGTQYALRGHGLPGSNGGPPGDMVVVVHVLVPSDLSEEQARAGRASSARRSRPHNLRSSGGEERELLLPRAPRLLG